MKRVERREIIQYLQELVLDKQQRMDLLENAEEALTKIGVPIRQPQLLPANAADLNIRP